MAEEDGPLSSTPTYCFQYMDTGHAYDVYDIDLADPAEAAAAG